MGLTKYMYSHRLTVFLLLLQCQPPPLFIKLKRIGILHLHLFASKQISTTTMPLRSATKTVYYRSQWSKLDDHLQWSSVIPTNLKNLNHVHFSLKISQFHSLLAQLVFLRLIRVICLNLRCMSPLVF